MSNSFRNFISQVAYSAKFKIILLVVIAVIIAGVPVYFWLAQVMPQATIYFLDDVVLPRKNQKVLIFSPHPDDETIGAGGYMAMSEKSAADVKIILVTDGNKHNLRNKRYEEFKQATKVLGVKEANLVFLNYPDGKLAKISKQDLYHRFKIEVDLFKPDIVIFPYAGDNHPDHAITGSVVSKILANTQIISYEYLVHHEFYPQPKKFAPNLFLLPPVNAITFDKEWKRLILPKDIKNQKLTAVYSYKTQLRTPFLKSLILSSVRQNELFSVNR